MHNMRTAYALGLVALVLAVLLRFLLDPLMGDALPLVTLFGAVAAAVWLGGYRPAIVVALPSPSPVTSPAIIYSSRRVVISI